MSTRSRFTFWRVMALAFFCAIVGFGAIIGTRRPSANRAWTPEHARMPEIVFGDSLVRIGNFRSFIHHSATEFEPRYQTRSVALDRLQSAWFVLTPFTTSWRGPAHGFVTFGFSDSTYLAISIEARREVSEEYSVLRGLGRNYELIYVIGDEADLIGKRALGDLDVYLYPIRTTPERARRVLVDMLHRADRLRATPEFYHTVSNSCVSNLVGHVNAIVPDRIPGGLKLIFPGYADEVAQRLGLIDGSVSIEEARRRYRINDRARAALGSPDFSLLIRRGP